MLRLFSYGSLQEASVQLATFGRLLAADDYERAADYARIAVTRVSGVDAWMYLDAAAP